MFVAMICAANIRTSKIANRILQFANNVYLCPHNTTY